MNWKTRFSGKYGLTNFPNELFELNWLFLNDCLFRAQATKKTN